MKCFIAMTWENFKFLSREEGKEKETRKRGEKMLHGLGIRFTILILILKKDQQPTDRPTDQPTCNLVLPCWLFMEKREEGKKKRRKQRM